MEERLAKPKANVNIGSTRGAITVHWMEAVCGPDMAAQASPQEAIPVRCRGDARRIARLGSMRCCLLSPLRGKEDAAEDGVSTREPLTRHHSNAVFCSALQRKQMAGSVPGL